MLKQTGIGKCISEKIGNMFSFYPFHPNTITLLSVVLAIFGTIALATGNGFQGFAFFILAFLFDAVDGAIARAKNMTSKKGAFLDGISDRLVEFFLIVGLVMLVLPQQIVVLALIGILFFGTTMTSFVKAYAEHSGLMTNETTKNMPGFLERAERCVLLLVATLLLLFGFTLYFTYVIYLTVLLSFATFVQRIVLATR